MQSPQFSLRLLLVVLASCSLAFAQLARPSHEYVVLAAFCVLVFWFGFFCVFVGAMIELMGEAWLMLGVFTGVLGVLVCILSLFTGLFYVTLVALLANWGI